MAGKADQQPASSTLKAALDACRRHIGFVILFSACLNLLYLAPSIYMLQVYDRVLASGGVLTLDSAQCLKNLISSFKLLFSARRRITIAISSSFVISGIATSVILPLTEMH